MKKALTLALLSVLAVGPSFAAGGSQHSSQMQGGQQSMNQDTVRKLQEQLGSQGYDVGKADGVMGPRTEQALMSFQRDQNLEPTGKADQKTMAALGIESSGQQAEMPQDQQRGESMDQQLQQRGQEMEQRGEEMEQRGRELEQDSEKSR